MVSLIFKLAIALTAIKLVALSPTPTAANLRLSPDKTVTPAPGRCESYGNRFARVDQKGVDAALSWSQSQPTPRTLGSPYCWLTADPRNPGQLRAVYPIIGSNQWLVVHMDTQGWFKGISFLVGVQ